MVAVVFAIFLSKVEWYGELQVFFKDKKAVFMKNTLLIKVQQGFTLIELMIVVAVMSVLAAVAIPVYLNYTVKAKLTEAVSLSSAARLAVGVACNERTLGAPAIDNASLGLSEPASMSGTYTKSVMASGVVDAGGVSSGQVTVVLKTIGAGINDGDTLVYNAVCDASGVKWDVTGSGDNMAKYLPKV
jgi:type IV pilus assembly protein PilA